MSISNNALIFYHTYTIESKKKSVYFTDFSIKTSFSLEYRDRFERLLGYYRLREKIEELFAAQKHSMVGRRSRVGTPERLRGRQFVQFVGLGYCFFFLNELKKRKARLGVDDGTKSAVQRKNESKLRSWLENKTLLQILQWFDAVYAMQVETPYGKRTITTETTARDELFLRELGITLVR